MEKVYENGIALTLNENEYDVDSTLFNKSTAASYSIKISLSSDTNKYLNYNVSVVASDFDGEYFSNLTIGQTTLDIVSYSYKIKNSYVFSYIDENHSFSQTGSPITILRNQDGKPYFVVSSYHYVLDTAAKTLSVSYEGTDTPKVSRIFNESTMVVLTVKATGITIDGEKLIIARNGSVSADTMSFVDGMNCDFYTDVACESKDIISATTVFSENTDIYMKARPIDYTGKAFVGQYYQEGTNMVAVELKADGTFDMGGHAMTYTAEQQGSNWEINLSGNKLIFTTSTNSINMQNGTLFKVDTATNAVVTIVNAASYDNTDLNGKYVVEKGKPFNSVIDVWGDAAKLVFSTYSGANITADTTIEISGLITSSVRLYEGIIYGSYMNGCFVFGNERTLSYQKNGADTLSGTYKAVDLTESTLTISLTLSNDDVITATIASKLTVADGSYQGEYALREYLNGSLLADTIFVAVGDESYRFDIDCSGYVITTNVGISGSVMITDIDGRLYSITIVQQDKPDIAITIDMSMGVKSFDYNEKTYKAGYYDGEVYLGDFAKNGVVYTLRSEGDNLFLSGDALLHRYLMESAEVGATFITMNFGAEQDPSDKIVVEYNITDDTITVESVIYTRATDYTDNSREYMGQFTSENSGSLTINKYGFILYNNSTYIGYISNVEEKSFTVNYADTTTANVTRTNYKYVISYNGVDYVCTILILPHELRGGYYNCVIDDSVTKLINFSAEDNELWINENTKDTIPAVAYNILSTEDSNGMIVTISACLATDSTSVVTITYNRSTRQITYGGNTFNELID